MYFIALPRFRLLSLLRRCRSLALLTSLCAARCSDDGWLSVYYQDELLQSIKARYLGVEMGSHGRLASATKRPRSDSDAGSSSVDEGDADDGDVEEPSALFGDEEEPEEAPSASEGSSDGGSADEEM